MKKSIIIALIIAQAVSVFAGGGWTKKKGEGFFYFYERVLYGNQFFKNDGTLTSIPSSGVYFTSLYGEYGLTDRFTIYGNVPVFVRATKNAVQYTSGLYIPGDQVNSMGDADIALKYGLIQNKPVVLSVSAWAGLPLGNPSGGESKILQTGDGEFNQMLRFDASGSFASGIFMSAYLGYNNRTNGFSDDIHFGGEIGYSKNSFFAIMKFIGLESTYNGTSGAVEGGIFSNNVEYLSYGPEVGYYFSDAFGVLGGVQGAFYAKSVIATPSFQLGIFYDLKKAK